MTKHLETTAIAAFDDEFRQTLPAIAAALATADRNPLDRSATQEAYRLIHALKGAASMVGFAAFGHLLHVAEEMLEGSIAGAQPVTGDVLLVLGGSLPRFAGYMQAALEGHPVETLAFDLARALHQDGGPESTAALKALLEIEAREIASLRLERAEQPEAPPEPTPDLPSPTEASAESPGDDALWGLLDLQPSDHAGPARVEPSNHGRTSSLAEPLPESLPSVPSVVPVPAPPPVPAAHDLDLLPPEQVPPELAEVFGLEAQEHLETIARLTSQLNPDAQDRDQIQELRRAVHTLKGAAGVVGYKGASRLAHRMEDLLDRLYEATAILTPGGVRTLASSSDALHDLIIGTSDAAGLAAIVGRLFDEFDTHVSQGSGLPGSGNPIVDSEPGNPEPGNPEPVPPAPPVIGITPDGQPMFERRRRGLDRRRSGEDRRGGGQVLRVPIPRLDELVRVVSELVINRSTFEQHHMALIEQVDELKLTTARLRRVALKLESDYEVRALAGNLAMVGSSGERDRASASASGHGFDDLEFDRYTEFHLLTRELNETTSDIATIGTRVAGTIGDFDADLTRLGRLTREIQDKTMEFRMVPLGTLTTQLERAVRATGETCGKAVNFAIEGEHVALDKSLLEQMADPLLHLLRNAVDHGIESGDQRRVAGKPDRGQITVRAFHEGTNVLIEVEDDGSGLDLERIRQTAVARGYVSEVSAASMSPEAIYAFIFEPGFSTARQVSEVSGRGVGMDVVKSKVGKLSGRVYVNSRPGAGTTISVRVPMTLAITRILLVRSGGETFGLPLGAVVQIVRPHPSAIGTVGTERVFAVDGQTFPLRDLAETLGLPKAADAPSVQPVLIANLARRRIALAVDEILNSRDAVVKTLGSHLRHVRGIWGATLLGDGTVVLILNPADLVGATGEPVIVSRPAPRLGLQASNEPYTVLVVDDSLSMRHVLSQAVKKAGWIPVAARDGIEALEIIHRGSKAPDLVLLDIEMPRMDGYEFLSTIRAQKGRADLPIVMLTSRSSDKHRDKAQALGVTDYMVKPFQEDTLVQNIDRLVKASRMAHGTAAS